MRSPRDRAIIAGIRRVDPLYYTWTPGCPVEIGYLRRGQPRTETVRVTAAQIARAVREEREARREKN